MDVTPEMREQWEQALRDLAEPIEVEKAPEEQGLGRLRGQAECQEAWEQLEAGLKELETVLEYWEKQRQIFRIALGVVHGQTPRQLFEEYQAKIQEDKDGKPV